MESRVEFSAWTDLCQQLKFYFNIRYILCVSLNLCFGWTHGNNRNSNLQYRPTLLYNAHINPMWCESAYARSFSVSMFISSACFCLIRITSIRWRTRWRYKQVLVMIKHSPAYHFQFQGISSSFPVHCTRAAAHCAHPADADDRKERSHSNSW